MPYVHSGRRDRPGSRRLSSANRRIHLRTVQPVADVATYRCDVEKVVATIERLTLSIEGLTEC